MVYHLPIFATISSILQNDEQRGTGFSRCNIIQEFSNGIQSDKKLDCLLSWMMALNVHSME